MFATILVVSCSSSTDKRLLLEVIHIEVNNFLAEIVHIVIHIRLIVARNRFLVLKHSQFRLLKHYRSLQWLCLTRIGFGFGYWRIGGQVVFQLVVVGHLLLFQVSTHFGGRSMGRHHVFRYVQFTVTLVNLQITISMNYLLNLRFSCWDSIVAI